MSLVEWIIIGIAGVIIFLIGYAGVTGKAFFSFKNQKDSKNKHP